MPHVSFPWKIIWKSRVPPCVAFFVWIAALERILTINNLWERHVGARLVLHVQNRLSLHCSFAREILDMVFNLFFGLCQTVSWRCSSAGRAVLGSIVM